MKKSILNLGKTLSKEAQKTVTGGFSDTCTAHFECQGAFQLCIAGRCGRQIH
ncbi:hypothetical protein [Tenacibaculum sp. 190524A05c]|uniref:Bacteriocin n=1 Tax=Tenacibaculum platacis TaxID=3137852 RepID=A0ABM9P2K4_9FLAO